MFILKHRPVYKFTEGPNDADLVTSIYFDNDNLELYQGRLKK
jgi:SPX domain protein involved in polyphosphate accumulation